MSKHICTGSVDDNLQRVWTEIKAYYTMNNTSGRYTHILRSMIWAEKADKMAQLSGKASEVRYLNFPLKEIWSRYMDRTNVQHVQVEIFLTESCNIESVLERNSPDVHKLPPDDARAYSLAVERYCVVYNALGNYYAKEIAPPRPLFNVTVKAHYMMHTALLAKWWNPRAGWCYSGEDYMNVIRKVMALCARHLEAYDVPNKFCYKYRLGIHTELIRPSDESQYIPCADVAELDED